MKKILIGLGAICWAGALFFFYGGIANQKGEPLAIAGALALLGYFFNRSGRSGWKQP